MPARAVVYFSPQSRPAPPVVREFAARGGHQLVEYARAEDVIQSVGRSYPVAVLVDGSEASDEALTLCRAIKSETFTAIVPVVMHMAPGDEERSAQALEAGADEVLTPLFSRREFELRLLMAVRRAERDVSVHPTTRLPGTVQIERDLADRLKSGEKFAVCYADLDHFKEFNDRYGYNHGDRIILIVSRILRDIVRAHSAAGFVGHIGGDDFIFIVPFADMARCCDDVVEVFDELIPLQYHEEDRVRGYFLGKDRRGVEYQVPLMTLSIGVVTNQHREFIHPAEISELATEMKAYAKSLPGSVWAVDRRRT